MKALLVALCLISFAVSAQSPGARAHKAAKAKKHKKVKKPALKAVAK